MDSIFHFVTGRNFCLKMKSSIIRILKNEFISEEMSDWNQDNVMNRRRKGDQIPQMKLKSNKSQIFELTLISI